MARKTQYKRKLEYNNQYNRENYKSFSVRFNVKDEADIIAFLKKKESLKSYLSSLIEADMKKSKKPTKKNTKKKA